MTRLIVTLCLACLLSGCRTYSYSRTDADGSAAKVSVRMWFSNSKVGRVEVVAENGRKLILSDIETDIDTEALAAIADAITSAALKGATGL